MDDLFGGIFGDMFDFNGDGDLDAFEQAAEFGLVMEMMDEEDGEDDGFGLDGLDEDEEEDEVYF